MDEDVRDRLQALYEHLAATGERPVETRASQWLGEAEAAAEDAADPDIPDAAARKRVGQVRHLLGEVDDTGDEEADDHVEAALELAKDLERDLEDVGVM
jgi:hypothetical protein